jgi:hypothetical protein
METNVTTKPTCEAHKRSTNWGEATPCDKPMRGKALCTGHLMQLKRRDYKPDLLTPLLGRHGRKRDDVVYVSTRVGQTVATKIEALGVQVGARKGRSRYRGVQALLEHYARGDLKWKRDRIVAYALGHVVDVDIGARVERTVADRVAMLGVQVGARTDDSRYQGVQMLAYGYANGDLTWARGKEPKLRKRT